MTSSYKNVRIRHASGAPINANTPLSVNFTDTEINVVATAATPMYVANTTPLPLYVQSTPGYPVYNIMKGQYVRNSQIGADTSFPFTSPACTPANSQVTATFTPPTNPVYEHQVVVYNPSTETDLTVKIFAVCTPFAGAGGTADAYVDTLTIPKSQSITGTSINTYSNSIFGIFNGVSAKFVMSNNSVIATPVTPILRMREVL